MESQKFATQFKDLDVEAESAEASATPIANAPVEPMGESLVDNYDYTGQLAVDVYQTPKEIIIKSTIGGVQPEDLDISINHDLVTIRGVRRQEEVINEEDYIYKECHWGGFSRSIILPVDVKEDRIKASLKNGILTIVLPKSGKSKVRVVEVEDQD
ncbi:MAG: Hsp20/alpha crystallin family protein [Patescibacteria group bacterium]